MDKLFALVAVMSWGHGVSVSDGLRFETIAECQAAGKLIYDAQTSFTAVRWVCVPNVAQHKR